MTQASNTARLVVALMIVLFVLRIGATYPVLSDTHDAAWHISAGLNFLRRGVYEFEPQHPPLGRLAVSVLPYWLADLKLGPYREPWSVDWKEKDLDFYWRTLALARLGNLPFGVLLLLVTFWWSRDLFGGRAALAAVLLVSCSPNILAHSGVATVDIATTTTFLAACYAFWLWSRTGGWRHCVLSAVATSAAFLSKFSTLAYLPPVFLVFLFIGRRHISCGGPGGRAPIRVRLAQIAAYVMILGTLIWCAYGFEYVRIPPALAASLCENPGCLLGSLAGHVPLPASAFWQGIIDVYDHNQDGNEAYLFGELYAGGRWYYFPTALALKTTLPLLILTGIGVAYLRKQGRTLLNPAVVLLVPVAVVLAAAMCANINIGVRHILPLYPFLAMIAAAPFENLQLQVRSLKKASVILILLLGWHAAESAAAHPDYLAYFNQIARGRESDYLASSNLDWGQDLARLARFVEDRGIERIYVSYTGERPVEKFGIPLGLHPPDHPECCWLAAGVNQLKGLGASEEMTDLGGRPPDFRVGKSILVFKIPPEDDFWKGRSIQTGERIGKSQEVHANPR